MAVGWLLKVPSQPRVTAQVEALWLRESFVLRPVHEENQAKVPPFLPPALNLLAPSGSEPPHPGRHVGRRTSVSPFDGPDVLWEAAKQCGCSVSSGSLCPRLLCLPALDRRSHLRLEQGRGNQAMCFTKPQPTGKDCAPMGGR